VNGLEAARQIKERLPGIEVLLLSGTPSPYTLREMFCSDVGGCLLKSEPSEELMPALESLRAHRNFRSRRITELYREISQSAGKFQKISPQEMKILRLIVDRKSSKEIAAEMFVTLSTVEAHRTHLFRKLKLRSAVELVLYALRHGLVEL
jgi:two-component system response regulator NreC